MTREKGSMSSEVSPDGGKDAYTREHMQRIANLVNEEIPAHWGFFVMTFPFDGNRGRMNYVSNAKREDIAKLMKEFLDKGGFRPGHHKV